MAAKESRLTEIYKSEKSRGGGLASAIGKRAVERIDPRQIFNQGGILAAVLPAMFKAYKATSGASRTPSPTKESAVSSSTDKKLDDIDKNTRIFAKNSLVLPAMARDMNLMRQNIAKLVKVQGGKPTYKADAFFKRASEREAEYEAKFGKESTKATTPTSEKTGKPKDLLSTLMGIGTVIAGAIAPILTSIKTLLDPLLDLAKTGVKLAFMAGGKVISAVAGSLSSVLRLAAPLLLNPAVLGLLGVGGIAWLLKYMMENGDQSLKPGDLTVASREGEGPSTPEEQAMVPGAPAPAPAPAAAAATEQEMQRGRGYNRSATEQEMQRGRGYNRAQTPTPAPAPAPASVTPTPTPAPVSTTPSTTETDLNKIFQFTARSGSRERFEQLQPDLKARLIQAATNYNNETGKKIQINSAVRTVEEQTKLWEQRVPGSETPNGMNAKLPNGLVIAHPKFGSSHYLGYAVDVDYRDPKVVAALNAAGLFQNVPNDPVHFSVGRGTKDVVVSGSGQPVMTGAGVPLTSPDYGAPAPAPAPATPSPTPARPGGIDTSKAIVRPPTKQATENLSGIASALQGQGFKDQNFINAALGTIYKETQGKPISENLDYSNTDLTRTRKTFGIDSNKVSDEELRKITQQGPEQFAEFVYGHKTAKGKQLGNTEPGDGWKYRGRGYIQLTGKGNYAAASQAIFGDDRLVKNPDLVNDPKVAELTAAYFLKTNTARTAKNLGIDMNQPLSQEDATRLAVGTVAGGVDPLAKNVNPIILEGAQKAHKFTEMLSSGAIQIPGVSGGTALAANRPSTSGQTLSTATTSFADTMRQTIQPPNVVVNAPTNNNIQGGGSKQQQAYNQANVVDTELMKLLVGRTVTI
jgi:predicted chitinase